jgi:hypothetical protein
VAKHRCVIGSAIEERIFRIHFTAKDQIEKFMIVKNIVDPGEAASLNAFIP